MPAPGASRRAAEARSAPRLAKASIELVVLAAVPLLLAAVLLFKDLGLEGVAADEATTTARVVELLETGHWLVPTLDGRADLTKPPLKIWVVAATVRLFGPSEATVRSWDAVAGLAVLSLAFVVATRFAGPLAGFVAALTLMTVSRFLFDHMSRSNVYDSFLTLFVSAAAIHHAFGGQSNRAAVLTGCLGALALLSKGVAALPLFAIIALFELHRCGLRGLAGRRLWVPVATAVALASLWYVPAALLAPRALAEEVRFEFGRRLLGEGAFSHPALYFEQVATTFRYWLAALVPAAFALRKAGPRGGAMLVLWPLVWLTAFGVASLPQDWYDLPAYPAIAALIGIGCAHAVDALPFGRARWRRVGAAAAFLAAFAPSLRVAYARTGRVRWTHSDFRRFAGWATAALPEDVPVFVLRPEGGPPIFAQHERLDAYKLRRRIRYRSTSAELCEGLESAPAAFVIVPAASIADVRCLRTFARWVHLGPTFYSHAFPFVPKDIVAHGVYAPPLFAPTEVVVDVAAGEALAGDWASTVTQRSGAFVRPMSGARAGIRFDLPRFESPVVRVEASDSSTPECDPEVRINGDASGSLSEARGEAGLPIPRERLRLSENQLEIVRRCPLGEVAVSRVVIRSEPTAADGQVTAALAREYGKGHHQVGARITDPDSPDGHAFATGGSYGPPGYLYFLPIRLPPGRYEAVFDLRAERLAAVDGTVRVDVYEPERRRRLSARDVPAITVSGERYVPVSLDFEIDAPTTVELRVETRDRSEIRLARVRVQSTWAAR